MTFLSNEECLAAVLSLLGLVLCEQHMEGRGARPGKWVHCSLSASSFSATSLPPSLPSLQANGARRQHVAFSSAAASRCFPIRRTLPPHPPDATSFTAADASHHWAVRCLLLLHRLIPWDPSPWTVGATRCLLLRCHCKSRSPPPPHCRRRQGHCVTFQNFKIWTLIFNLIISKI